VVLTVLLLLVVVPSADAVSRLQLFSVPSGADVMVNGVGVGTTPINLTEPAGIYDLVFTLEGYDPYATSVRLELDETRSIEAPLRIADGNGTLRVETTPVGAAAYLDGQLLGRTPYASGQTAAGFHELVLELDGYERHAERLKVIGGQLTRVQVTLDRTPTTGSIAVYSNPGGAEVLIDGQVVGSTPYEGRGYGPGTHPVVVRHAGYRDYRVEAKVEANRRTEISATLETAPADGVLSLTSIPEGARVYLDGSYRGTAPLRVAASPGVHSVRAEADGYMAQALEVELRSGVETPLSVVLPPMATTSATPAPTTTTSAGAIRIASSPEGAAITVDGEAVGVAPRTVRGLAPGAHRLSLSAAGYQVYEETVEVRSGETVLVNATLIRVKRTNATTANPSPTRTAPVYALLTPAGFGIAGIAVAIGHRRRVWRGSRTDIELAR
jgi:hypothetical protein